MQPDWDKAQQDIFVFCKCIGFVPGNLMQAAALIAAQRGESLIVVTGDRGEGKTTISCVISAWLMFRKGSASAIVATPTKMQREIWDRAFRCLMPRTGIYSVSGGDIQRQIRYGPVESLENIGGFHGADQLLVIDGADGLNVRNSILANSALFRTIIKVYNK